MQLDTFVFNEHLNKGYPGLLLADLFFQFSALRLGCLSFISLYRILYGFPALDLLLTRLFKMFLVKPVSVIPARLKVNHPIWCFYGLFQGKKPGKTQSGQTLG